MDRSITRQTIATSTNSIASICRTCIRPSAARLPIIWRNPSAEEWRGLRLHRRRLTSIPGLQATWSAISSGWERRVYTADQRSGSMHGKQFLMDEVLAGIDEQYVYGRLDFAGKVPEDAFQVVVNLESWANNAAKPRRELRVDAAADAGRLLSWKVTEGKDKSVADSN